MLKVLGKIFRAIYNPQLLMTIVAVVTVAISVVEMFVDTPPPGIAYTLGFLNATLIMTLFIYTEED